jgi:penicillin-binding protein 2
VSVRIEQQSGTAKNAYRFGSFGLAIIVAVAALSARMFDLQVMHGQEGYEIAQGQSAETITVPSSRGLIYDANGTLLVKNLPNFVIEIIPHDLSIPDRPVVVRRLASLLKMDPVVIDQELDSATGSFFDPVVIATNVDADVARIIDENHDALPGVQVLSRPLRQYTNGPLYGQLLGYTGRITSEPSAAQKAAGYSLNDVTGLAGIELQYEQELRGTYGKETIALDANGQPISGLAASVTDPVPGSSLTLSLSTREQALAQKALAWGMKQAKVKMGTIIVENPQNGEILAMVSLPGYDNNIFAQGLSQADYQNMLNDPNMPLTNKAVSEQYAPGSTYKLVTGTAGLQDGKITATSTIESKPYVLVGNPPEKFKEWNGVGWGPLNIIMGLAHSSDTFFYQLTQKVGLERLTYWAKQYGFGAPTGIDLPNEATGIVPDDQWKLIAKSATMFPGETLQAGIGQGYDAVTPLQLLNAYCALANGGNLWRPHVVTAITAPSGSVTPVPPKLLNKLPASQRNLQIMRQGTRAVVTSRHTYNMVELPIKIAGKTGTAEYGTKDRYGRYPYHEWFVGYTPADPYNGSVSGTDSQLAVVVFTYGADTWGDISTEIVKYYMWMHYNLKGSALTQSLPGHVNMWAFKITNFYGTANNH